MHHFVCPCFHKSFFVWNHPCLTHIVHKHRPRRASHFKFLWYSSKELSLGQSTKLPQASITGTFPHPLLSPHSCILCRAHIHASRPGIHCSRIYVSVLCFEERQKKGEKQTETCGSLNALVILPTNNLAKGIL